MTEREAYIAFNMVPKIGAVRLSALIARHGSAVAAWERLDTRPERHGRPIDWEGETAKAERLHVKIVTRIDPEYPQCLSALPSPPLALYVTGDPAALSRPGLAMVGTRSPTLYGLDMAGEFAAGIVRNSMSVISGLAVGIDAAAHKGALDAGGVTVGILGGALDRFFPDDNRLLARRMTENGGAVVSEFPFGFPPGKTTFPQRNRIVAALSSGVLAVETPLRGGSLITCAIAEEIGKPVMAIPGNLDSANSAGCWELIRNGAKMVTSADEAVAYCNLKTENAATQGANTATIPQKRSAAPEKTPSPAAAELTLEEAAVLKAVPSTGITLDRLAFVTKLPASTISAVTVALRLKKHIRYLPGNRIAPVAHQPGCRD